MHFAVHTIILSVLLQTPLILSLKCYNNYCAFGRDNVGATCMVEGDGVHEECGEPARGFTSACYEEPVSKESNQMKSRGCIALKNLNTSMDGGCSEENGQRINQYQSFGCLCFEDFCNTRFNNSLSSVLVTKDGHPARKTDGVILQLLRSNSEESFNEKLR